MTIDDLFGTIVLQLPNMFGLVLCILIQRLHNAELAAMLKSCQDNEDKKELVDKALKQG